MFVLCVILFFVTALANAGSPLEITCTDALTDCNYFIQGSSCIEGQCVCPDDAVANADLTACLPSAGLGVACTENVQCSSFLGSGGICNTTCACSPGYHYLKGRCWRSVPLNGACFQDEQCYSAFDFTGLECQGGTCTCRNEYYERGGSCRRRSAASESCIFNSDCDCEGGVCNSRVCSCGSQKDKKRSFTTDLKGALLPKSGCEHGFYEKDGQCLPEIGSPCDNSTVCALGVASSTCLDGRACGCDNLRIRSANNRACDKAILTFGSQVCNSDAACVPFGAKSVCATVDTKRVCACADDANYDPDAQFCRLKRSIGEACDVNADCYTKSGITSECKEKVCTCVAGTHAVDGGKDCLPYAEKVGDKCTVDDDCKQIQDSECNTETGVCGCRPHYFASKDGKCEAGIGAPCSEDGDCHSVDSICSTECTCSDDHIALDDFSACLELKGFGETCLQEIQCNPSMGELRVCTDSVCVCQEGAQFLQNRCYAIKHIGEKCKARAECVYPGDSNVEGYLCQNGICTCQYGFLLDGNRCISTQ